MFSPSLMKKYLAIKGITTDIETLDDLKKIFYRELINDKTDSKKVQKSS